jgi:hypothetical protein
MSTLILWVDEVFLIVAKKFSMIYDLILFLL